MHDARKCQSAEKESEDGDKDEESDESEGDGSPAKRTTTPPNEAATMDPPIESNNQPSAVEACTLTTPNTLITGDPSPIRASCAFSHVSLAVPREATLIHEEAFRVNGGADEFLSTLSDSDSDSDTETGFEFM